MHTYFINLNMKINLIFFLSALIILLTSCTKDIVHAERSVRGEWKVTFIQSFYGTFTETSFNADDSVEETGDLGTFNFTTDSVTFNYTRNDTLYTGTRAWDLASERVNAGFNRVTEYTLTIEDEFVFGVQFENGTKNSHKNAESMEWVETPTGEVNSLVTIQLETE